MKNLTIAKRISLGFALLILLTTIAGLYSTWQMTSIKQDANSVATVAGPGLATVEEMIARVQVINMLVYKHINSVDPADMSNLDKQITEDRTANSTQCSQLTNLYTEGAIHELIESSLTARTSYRDVTDKILNASRQATNSEQTAAVYKQARTTLDAACSNYDGTLGAISKAINKDANDRFKAIVQAASQTQLWTLICFSAVLVLGLIISIVIGQGTNRVLKGVAAALNDGANQVSSASAEVASASQTLAEGASEQAASLEETSSSLEEMASMTKRNAESAGKAKELATQTRHAADVGASDMQTMSQAMEGIKVSSAEIGKIIKTIDEIAFQTNILALNAAVEAARAGEAGMGFAVVADEVRNLAQRSAQAARETANKIEGAIAKTEQGVQISAKVLEGLQDIVAKVRKVDELVAEVAAASQEQSQGIDQVNTAISQMDKVTQSNAANAEESASASAELSSQADAVKDAVNHLLALVGGASEKQTASTSSTTAHKRPAPTKISTPHNTQVNVQSQETRHKDTPLLKHNSRAQASADAKKLLPMEGDFMDQ